MVMVMWFALVIWGEFIFSWKYSRRPHRDPQKFFFPIYSIQFNALFQTQCFYTLSVHSDTYNKNILITMKDNPTNNYIIILSLTKIVKELDSAIVIVDIE